jgi:hypothetical protein
MKKNSWNFENTAIFSFFIFPAHFGLFRGPFGRSGEKNPGRAAGFFCFFWRGLITFGGPESGAQNDPPRGRKSRIFARKSQFRGPRKKLCAILAVIEAVHFLFIFYKNFIKKVLKKLF